MLNTATALDVLHPEVATTLPRSSVRPVKDSDAEAMQHFIGGLSALSRRFRFHAPINACAPELLRSLTQVDGVHQMALVAWVDGTGGDEIVGEARYCLNRIGATSWTGDDADFAIAVADSCQGQGIADQLLGALLHAAEIAGVKRLHGDVLDGNTRMIGFLRRNGFAPEALIAPARGQSRWQRVVTPSHKSVARTFS